MSSEVVISVENLAKLYRIRHQRSGPRDGLRHVLNHWATAPLRWLGSNAANKKSVLKSEPPYALSHGISIEDFWALKEVSFEIKQGEVVGIIGRNGAGKSTLLKILSRITEPTKGRVRINGRVASLLEVGTGFHPELTGRENIFLNGAILGMSKVEIKMKFDEIVAFAEVEQFLDTPVKRYSSGMYVRLAFAVAAHLEPEILVVDEVLSVGDAAFQQKCMGKINSVAKKKGRTVLFVSHNLAAVQNLCQTGVWLHGGCVRQIGQIKDVARAYAMGAQLKPQVSKFAPCSTKGDGQVDIVSYRITNADGNVLPMPATKEDLLIHIALRVRKQIDRPACGVSLNNQAGVVMTCVNTVEQGHNMPPLPAGEVTICVRVNNITFLPGDYTASFWVMSPEGHIYVMTENSISFAIAQAPLYGTCNIDHRWGCVYSDIQFTLAGASPQTNERL